LRDDAEPQQRTAALEQAERFYHRSLATEPGRWLAYRGLARTLTAAGQPDAAIASLEDGIVRARNPELLNRELILLLLQQERLEEALVEIPAYLRDHPHDADILHNYVVLLGKTGRFKAAIDAAGKLVASVPDDPRGYVDLGVLLARRGDRAQARAVFVEGLRRFPAYPDLVGNLELLDGASVGPERE
jgi:Flp pilus assembly protein TadD